MACACKALTKRIEPTSRERDDLPVTSSPRLAGAEQYRPRAFKTYLKCFTFIKCMQFTWVAGTAPAGITRENDGATTTLLMRNCHHALLLCHSKYLFILRPCCLAIVVTVRPDCCCYRRSIEVAPRYRHVLYATISGFVSCAFLSYSCQCTGIDSAARCWAAVASTCWIQHHKQR